jgi:hypothetical protein
MVSKKYRRNRIQGNYMTQKGGVKIPFTGITLGRAPDYKNIEEALTKLATIKKGTMYKILLAWADEKGVSLFSKVSDARSKLERFDKFIDEINKGKINMNLKDTVINESILQKFKKSKFKVRIILCLAYLYCKNSNIEETNITAFAKFIKSILTDKQQIEGQSKRDVSNKIIENIKQNLISDRANLKNYNLIIINLYEKVRNRTLAAKELDTELRSAQEAIYKQEQELDAKLAAITSPALKTQQNINATKRAHFLNEFQKFRSQYFSLLREYQANTIEYKRIESLTNIDDKEIKNIENLIIKLDNQVNNFRLVKETFTNLGNNKGVLDVNATALKSFSQSATGKSSATEEEFKTYIDANINAELIKKIDYLNDILTRTLEIPKLASTTISSVAKPSSGGLSVPKRSTTRSGKGAATTATSSTSSTSSTPVAAASTPLTTPAAATTGAIPPPPPTTPVSGASGSTGSSTSLTPRRPAPLTPPAAAKAAAKAAAAASTPLTPPAAAVSGVGSGSTSAAPNPAPPSSAAAAAAAAALSPSGLGPPTGTPATATNLASSSTAPPSSASSAAASTPVVVASTPTPITSSTQSAQSAPKPATAATNPAAPPAAIPPPPPLPPLTPSARPSARPSATQSAQSAPKPAAAAATAAATAATAATNPAAAATNPAAPLAEEESFNVTLRKTIKSLKPLALRNPTTTKNKKNLSVFEKLKQQIPQRRSTMRYSNSEDNSEDNEWENNNQAAQVQPVQQPTEKKTSSKPQPAPKSKFLGIEMMVGQNKLPTQTAEQIAEALYNYIGSNPSEKLLARTYLKYAALGATGRNIQNNATDIVDAFLANRLPQVNDQISAYVDDGKPTKDDAIHIAILSYNNSTKKNENIELLLKHVLGQNFDLTQKQSIPDGTKYEEKLTISNWENISNFYNLLKNIPNEGSQLATDTIKLISKVNQQKFQGGGSMNRRTKKHNHKHKKHNHKQTKTNNKKSKKSKKSKNSKTNNKNNNRKSRKH